MARKPKKATTPKNLPPKVIPVKTKPKPHEEREFRNLAVSEEEARYLLKLSKDEKLGFPRELVTRLVWIIGEFEDQLLKLKELIKRAKANSFWVDLKSANAEVLEKERERQRAALKETLNEIAHIPAPQLKKILDKERLAKNVTANKRRREAATKDKAGN
jgi:hypothetical protein